MSASNLDEGQATGTQEQVEQLLADSGKRNGPNASQTQNNNCRHRGQQGQERRAPGRGAQQAPHQPGPDFRTWVSPIPES